MELCNLQTYNFPNFRRKYSEVIRCADMIGRAVRKIDIRTRMAMVKFNTDKGRLEPLLIEMGAKLEYSIEALDKEIIYKEGEQGNNASHTILLIDE